MFDVFRVKQNLPYCRRGRAPPDPALFPHYFQNAQHMWCHFTEWWPRDRSFSKCNGVVYIVNGVGEHAGRYDGFAEFLNANGFVVFSQDNQGAGGSEGLRLYVEKFSDFVRDVQDFIKYIETCRYPNEIGQILLQTPHVEDNGSEEKLNGSVLPSDRRFLLGHSMGGLIASLVAQKYPPSFFGGAILSGPAFVITDTPGVLIRGILRFLGMCIPKLKLHHLDDKQDLCSSNPPVKELLAQDPYYGHTRLRAHFLVEFVDAQEVMWNELKKAELSRVLVIHGMLDRLCSPAGSQRFHNEVRATEKKLRLYANSRHEVLTERCFAEVWEEVLDFLTKEISHV